LVLSVFPGIDLLGRGFEAEGFCVVRGPDLLWGGDVRDFHPPAGRFEGVIAGSPCQDFSRARRSAPTGEGLALLEEFVRVVTEARPNWFLLENVPTVPTVHVAGYRCQRLDLDARECGLQQRRLRHFQWGSAAGLVMVVTRCAPAEIEESQATCLAGEGRRQGRRSWADFCALQGLPADFALPGMTLAARYAAVGNGVAVPVARVFARAILGAVPWHEVRLCACGCGRSLRPRQVAATPACRKRLERRRRDSAGVTRPGPVTPAASQSSLL
jgi:DNA (cytosine-5)-methyltransferase 1